MGKMIGIDLGGTNCRVAYIDDEGAARIIEPLDDPSNAIPCVVYFEPDTREVFVGTTARQLGALHPECMVEGVKNYMGDPDYFININGQDYSPADIFSFILSKAVSDAEFYFGDEEIKGAIITCPAYFSVAAREATRKAGENVTLKNGEKLKVIQILDEPVAAALAYGNALHEDMKKNVLIYDLGGGTFDCTVMNIDFAGDEKKMKVITIGGNHQLGGKNWDDALLDFIIDDFCNNTFYNPGQLMNSFQFMQYLTETV